METVVLGGAYGMGGEEELGEKICLTHEHNTTIRSNIITHLVRMYLQILSPALYTIIENSPDKVRPLIG